MLVDNFAESLKKTEEITQKMTNLLNDSEFTSFIEGQKNKLKKWTIIGFSLAGGFGLIIGIILGVLGKSVLLGVIPVLIGLFLGLIIYFFLKNAVNHDYAVFLVPKVVKAVYGDQAIYKKNGGYSRDFLDGINSFPVNRLAQEDYISGTYNGINATMCDIVSYHYETRNDGKNTTTTKVIDFAGTVMRFNTKKTSTQTLRVNEKTLLFNGKSIDFESINFNKKFNVYCSDMTNAINIITPGMQLGMLDVEQSLKGNVSFLFRNNELIVVIAGKTTSFNPDFKKDNNYNLNLILDAILPLAYIITTLDLSRDIYVNADQLLKNNRKKTSYTSDVDSAKKGLESAGINLDDSSINELKQEIDK